MKRVIEVKKLIKKYGALNAVNDVSFHVLKGEVFGLLGENGAGKTTSLEIIEGLRKASSGNIKILGHDIKKGTNSIKEKIGVQLQSSAYYDFLNLHEILDLFGSFYQESVSPQELLKLVELENKSKSYIKKLSGGQKQRFSIVASLVNNPDIVFLDEPTTGLDPLARRNVWDLINKIRDQGKTIILTTHYMEEAEKLCDRVAIMEKGKIIAMDETHKLVRSTKCPFKIDLIAPKIKPETIKQLEKLGKVETINGKTEHFEIRFQTNGNLNQAINIIQKIKPESLTVGKTTLEDLFIELTGKKIQND
ncbi:ABC transporter ATP-binding protein [Patescibacteria group bacterium]